MIHGKLAGLDLATSRKVYEKHFLEVHFVDVRFGGGSLVGSGLHNHRNHQWQCYGRSCVQWDSIWLHSDTADAL